MWNGCKGLNQSMVVRQQIRKTPHCQLMKTQIQLKLNLYYNASLYPKLDQLKVECMFQLS